MIFKFKIIPTDKESKIAESFGDVVKIKLQISNCELQIELQEFLASHLCISQDLVKIIEFNERKSIATVDLPDEAYEIIMSWVEST